MQHFAIVVLRNKWAVLVDNRVPAEALDHACRALELEHNESEVLVFLGHILGTFDPNVAVAIRIEILADHAIVMNAKERENTSSSQMSLKRAMEQNNTYRILVSL